MLEFRVTKVWMLTDGQPGSQMRCSEYCGLHQGVFLVADEWFKPNLLCQS